MRVSMRRFESAVDQALAAVPSRFQPYLKDIEFVVAESSPEGLLGEYVGATALEDFELPPRVTVFKDAHEDCADTWEELVAEVRRTVLHEVGHHFGMDEHELPY